MADWKVVARGNLLEGYRWSYIVYRTKTIPRNPDDIVDRWHSEFLFASSEEAREDFDNWASHHDYDVVDGSYDVEITGPLMMVSTTIESLLR